MANTIAYCTGYDSNRSKDASRLGSRGAEGRAQTWRTFAVAYVDADGSGYVEVRRNERVGQSGSDVIHRFDFGPEGDS